MEDRLNPESRPEREREREREYICQHVVGRKGRGIQQFSYAIIIIIIIIIMMLWVCVHNCSLNFMLLPFFFNSKHNKSQQEEYKLLYVCLLFRDGKGGPE
jgi:Na+/melibiose symporter-like transporter